MGLAFQFPLITLLIARIGLIKSSQLSKNRHWAYFSTLFFAILLPLDSVLADFYLALPLVVLFEITLILIRISEKRKKSS
jgi:sec-independent protein translocase protein TatC